MKFKKGHTPWNKGRNMSQKQKDFLSKFWKGKRMGDENPSKRPEVRKKISEALKGRDCHWLKGKERSDVTKLKISIKNSGSRNGAWNGGTSKNRRYGMGFNNFLKDKIRKRDNHVCQICRKIQKERKCKLDIHHIDYNKSNNDIINLISLCHSCHSKTNFNREKWKKKLDTLLSLQLKYISEEKDE